MMAGGKKRCPQRGGGGSVGELRTGTGFAEAKLSKVLPRSERSLALVRMTELGLVLLSTKKIRCGVELPTGGDMGVACSGGLGAVASLY